MLSEIKKGEILEIFKKEDFRKELNKCKNKKEIVSLFKKNDMDVTIDDINEFMNDEVKELNEDKLNISGGAFILEPTKKNIVITVKK